MKMHLQVSLTWLLLLSATLLSEPASGFWWNSPGGSATGGQNSLWNKFSDWIKGKFHPKVPEDPQLRLVSGRDQCSGRVEVYHEGKWGTVCDDNFNLNSGSVVCRQLDCGQVVSVLGWSYFGPGRGDILLDDVQCRGTESYLWDCQHAGWGRHNCGHNEDVGVICSGVAPSTVAPTASSKNPQTSISASTSSTASTVVTSTTEPPTSTGKDTSSAPTSSPAGTETPSAPGTLTTPKEVTSSASTIVTEENATSAPEITTTVYIAPYGSTAASLDSTTVTEESRTSEILTTLQIDHFVTDDLITSAPLTDSAEPLTTTPAPSSQTTGATSAPSLRLADGGGRCSGRVELYHDGSWGTVCDDAWELADAEVVCRALGCGEALLAVPEARFGQGSGNILLDEVQCRGDEDDLRRCSHRGIGVHNCHHKEDAGVICAEPVTPLITTVPVPADMSLRLVNGGDACSGRLEVFYNSSWATVCDDGWDMEDAAVVCRQLGCGYALSAKTDAFFGEGTGGILLDDVQCRGDESSLEQCSHRELGTHDCYHKEDAGVICEVPLELTTAETTVPTKTTTAETPVTVSPSPEPDVTTSPAENTTPEAAVPTESTTAEETVTNSSALSVSPTPEAAAITTSQPKPDPAPKIPEYPYYLPKYMRVMLLRFLTGLCRPRRPGTQNIRLQGCVRDPTCGNYYSPGMRIVRFRFRGSIYPRVCLRCRILACNRYRYNYYSQGYHGYLTRGKRSTDDTIVIIIPK